MVPPLIFRHGAAAVTFNGTVALWVMFELVATVRQRWRAGGPAAGEVRGMAATLSARRRLGGALAAVAGRQNDPVPGVCAAAARATAVLAAGGA